MVRYSVHKNLTLFPILSQMYPVHNLPHYISLRFILILSSNLLLHLPYGFPTKILHTFLIYTTHATFPVHLILLDWITLITLGDAYKL